MAVARQCGWPRPVRVERAGCCRLGKMRRYGRPSSSVNPMTLSSNTFDIVWRQSRQKSVIALAGGDNGFGGGYGGGSPPFPGGGGNWGEDDDGGKIFDLKSFMIGLLLLGMPSALLLHFYRKRTQGDLAAGYDVDPVRSLKRLVRELFEKDVETQERLRLMEEKLGIVHDGAPGMNASRVMTSKTASRPAAHDGAMLRSVGGRLTLGGGLLWSEDADTSNLDAMVDSGVQLGTRLMLQSRGQFRQGKDFILTDINIDGASQEEYNLQKVLYSCGLTERIKIMFAPFGARGNDVTYTLNPFAGRGLTSATSEGNPLLHNKGRGSMIGSTISLPRSWMTVAFFRNEEDETPEKTLAQIIVAPTRQFSVGMSVLEAQPEGSPRVREYRAMLLNSILKRQRFAPRRETAGTTDGRSTTEFASNFALSVGNNFALHGWAASDSIDSLINASPSSMTWNISFGDKLKIPSDDANTLLPRWVASIGKCSGADGTTLAPDMLEFSTEFDLGNGMSCHPGMVAVRDATSTWTVLAGAKAVWDF